MTQTNTNDTQTYTSIHGELFDYPEGHEFIGMSWHSLLWQKRSEMPEKYRVKGTGRYKYLPTLVTFYTNDHSRLEDRLGTLTICSLMKVNRSGQAQILDDVQLDQLAAAMPVGPHRIAC